MKKIAIVAAMAIAAATFTACGNSTPKADLKNDVDTMSYAMGMAQTQGLKDFLVGRMQIDTTYMDEFTKSISLKNFMAGFIAGTTGKTGSVKMTAEEAQQIAQAKMMAIKGKNMEKQYGPNKAAGEKWLAENKKKAGVKTLPSGVQYRVIKEGKGAMPQDTSTVVVNYEGKTIDGKVFDSSYKRGEPITLKANQVIKGWTDALVHMPAGSVWEVYIPQQLAYGDREQGQIKPFSALIFKIELVKVGGK